MTSPSAPLCITLPPLADRSYDIHIGRGYGDRLDAWLDARLHRRRLAVITDSVVAAHLGGALMDRLRQRDPATRLFSFLAGEERKTR